MNGQLEDEAKQHEGLAEVYDRFVARFLQDAVHEYVLIEMEKLTGPAELLEVDAPYRITEPILNWQAYWYYLGGQDRWLGQPYQWGGC